MTTQEDHFEGSYKDYNIILDAPNDTTVIIKVENKNTKEKYTRTINQKFIKLREQFNCFRDPLQIYEWLTKKWPASIKRLEDWAIFFDYEWGDSVQKKRQIVIELRQEIEDSLLPLQLENTKLKEELQNWKKGYQNLFTEYQKLKKECQEHTNELQKLKAELEQANVNHAKQIAQKNSEIDSLKKQLEEALKKVQNLIGPSEICYHPATDRNLFQLTNITPHAAKLKCLKSTSDWYVFNNGVLILPGQKKRYRLKIIDTGNSLQMFGFASQLNSKYSAPQTVFYSCNGFFWRESASIMFPTSQNGDVFELEADLVNDTLRWVKNGSLFKESPLPTSMAGKAVYLTILMDNFDETVDIEGI